MKTIYLHIAGFFIAMNFYESEVIQAQISYMSAFRRLHRNFIVTHQPDKVDYEVDIVWDDNQEIIFREKEKKYFIRYSQRVGTRQVKTYYHTGMFQLQIILRDILQSLLIQNEGYIFHASASLINNKAYLFTGKSGAGKSTIVSLLSNKHAVIADDVVVIKKEKGSYWCYYVPFIEKNWKINKVNKKYPLQGIFFLKQSSDFSVEKIEDKHTVFKYLAQQLFTRKGDTKVQLSNLFTFILKENYFYSLSFAKNKKKVLELLEDHSYEAL